MRDDFPGFDLRVLAGFFDDAAGLLAGFGAYPGVDVAEQRLSRLLRRHAGGLLELFGLPLDQLIQPLFGLYQFLVPFLQRLDLLLYALFALGHVVGLALQVLLPDRDPLFDALEVLAGLVAFSLEFRLGLVGFLLRFDPCRVLYRFCFFHRLCEDALCQALHTVRLTFFDTLSNEPSEEKHDQGGAGVETDRHKHSGSHLLQL